MKVTVRICGTPHAKARPRFSRGVAYTAGPTRTYEKLVSQHGQIAMLEGKFKTTHDAVRVEIALIFPIPESWSKKRRSAALCGELAHTTGPDSDNCAKALLDALNGIVYDDDSQVVDLRVTKSYGPSPEAVVCVETLNPSIAMRAA